MKVAELQPTNKNLIASLKRDPFSRNIDLFRFTKLCCSIEDNAAIAINGKWGSGKTFFVKQLKLIFDAYNNLSSTLSEDERKTIINCIEKCNVNAAINNQIVFYYDAWANDNDVDPMLSIIYQLAVSSGTEFFFDDPKSLLKSAAYIIEQFAGNNNLQFAETLKKDNSLEIIKQQKVLQKSITDFLSELIPEHGDRMIIIIDELDRCRPDFAVSLLERVKHYFLNDRVTFIFSINTLELQHTISNVYGVGFDSCRYLDRFFDLQIDLPEPDLSNLFSELGLKADFVYNDICKRVIQYCNFEIREINRFNSNAILAYDKSSRFEFSFSDGKAIEFGLLVLVPILIGLKMCDITKYDKFIHGEDSSPLIAVLTMNEEPLDYCSELLSQDETFDKNSASAGHKVIDYRERIKQYYAAMFSNHYESDYQEIRIGELSISKNTRNVVMHAASLISNYGILNG